MKRVRLSALAVLGVFLFFSNPALAFTPSPTSPYGFADPLGGSDFDQHYIAGDGFYQLSGCDPNSSNCNNFGHCQGIGYNWDTGAAKAPILTVVGNQLQIEYFITNAYCNPSGSNPNQPNAITYFVFLYSRDPVTGAATGIHTVAPYWEHGYVYYTINPASCGYLQALYEYADHGGGIHFLSSNIVGPFGQSNGRACLVEAGPCPNCNGTAGPAPSGIAQPVNIGTGNMFFSQPLFSVSENTSNMAFTLSYNSRDTTSPGPLGWGFTHPFNQHLSFYSSGTKLIKLIDGNGAMSQYYSFTPGTDPYLAVWPADATGTMTLSGGVYTLTALEGTVTTFDATTGHWNSTTDRWGNAYTATYTTGSLTKITDPEGRAWNLTYTSGRLTSIVDPDSHTWSFGYDGTNNYLTKIADPVHTLASPWRQLYYVTGYAGDPMQVLSLVKDDASVVLEGHEYDSAGRAVSSFSGDTTSTGANAKAVVTLAYDSSTQTTATTAIDGVTSSIATFTYTAPAGRVLPTIVDGNCPSCPGGGDDYQDYTYDSLNRILTKTVGVATEQSETDFTYDCTIPTPTPLADQIPACDGRVTKRVDAVGKPGERTTTFAYAYVPPSGAPWPTFLTSITQPSAAHPGQNASTTYTWSGTGETQLVTAQTGYLNASSSVTYNTTTHFDAKHRVTEIDGPATNEKTTRVYFADVATDNGGRLSTEALYTSAAHLDTTYASYDLFGTAKTITDPNGVQTVKTADNRGRITSVTSKKPAGDVNEPADYVTTYTIDSRDRITDVFLPASSVTKTHYGYEDGTNRLTDTIRADSAGNQRERHHLTLNLIGGKAAEEADYCGTPAASCGAWTLARKDTFAYDMHNRLSSLTHSLDGTHINYTYDSRGNLTTSKDENHATANTTSTYDFLNRLTNVTQALSTSTGNGGGCPASAGFIATCYTYDVQDNLAEVTDPNGNSATYAFDDFHRLQAQASPVTGTTTYTYDPAGNLTSSTDARFVVTSRIYDAANRILSSSAAGPGVVTETVNWTYDDATAFKYRLGRLSTMTDPAGSSTYSYERRGVLTTDAKTVAATLFTTGYGYDPNGNRIKITYPSTRVVNYTFDFADRPVKVSSGATTYVDNTGTPPSGFFAYQPFGPESWENFGNGTVRTFAYDQRYRPLENKLVKSSPLTTLADYTYAEDSVGNITGITDAANASYNRTLGYDDLNRLTTATTPTTGTPPLWGSGSYAYDAMGNLTSATLGSTTRAFAYQGTLPMLSAVTENGVSRPVAYDFAGNESYVDNLKNTYSARNYLLGEDGESYTYDGRGLRSTVRSNVLGSSAAMPVSLAVDTSANGALSNGNKYFEPGEQVLIDPTWRNSGSSSITLTSTAASVTGPSWFTGSIVSGHAGANYGTIGAGAAADCATAGSCYWLTGTVTGTRPGSSPHGDLQLTETASTGGTVAWTVHIGNTFSDVTASGSPGFYPYIERLVHNEITLGVGGDLFQPSASENQTQSAIFLARAILGSDALVPTAGPGYNCVSGGTSQIPDVTPTSQACRYANYLFDKTSLDFCDLSGDFCPANTTTRKSMAIMVSRVLVAPDGDAGVPTAYTDPVTTRSYDCAAQGTIPFPDIHPTDSFCRNVCYVWALGVVDGNTDGTYGPNGNLLRSQMAKFLDIAFHLTISGIPAAGPASGAYARDFVYSPEMNLLAESSISSFGGNPSPTGGYDYIWFNGHPVAEENGGTHWILTDHLGTPVLQTNSSGAVYWQAEYEPYGRVWALRTADQHQALRFPGQEADELNISGDGNGSSERSYNIFRWYRAKWGRYTQADPLTRSLSVWQDPRTSAPLFGYGSDNPLFFQDINGLAPGDRKCCDCPDGQWGYSGVSNGLGILIGYTNFHGTFTCRSRPNLRVPVDGFCWSGGAQAFASVIQYDTSATALGLPGAKACNASDLIGTSRSILISSRVIVGASGDPNQSTGTVSAGIGIGAGIAGQKCTTKLYVPLVPSR